MYARTSMQLLGEKASAGESKLILVPKTGRLHCLLVLTPACHSSIPNRTFLRQVRMLPLQTGPSPMCL